MLVLVILDTRLSVPSPSYRPQRFHCTPPLSFAHRWKPEGGEEERRLSIAGHGRTDVPDRSHLKRADVPAARRVVAAPGRHRRLSLCLPLPPHQRRQVRSGQNTTTAYLRYRRPPPTAHLQGRLSPYRPPRPPPSPQPRLVSSAASGCDRHGAMHVATHLRRGHSSTLGFERLFLQGIWRAFLCVFAGCGWAELGITMMSSFLLSLVGEVTFTIFS